MNVARRRLWTCLAVCLIVILVAATSASAGLFSGLFGGHKAKKAADAPRQTLVVFPFDQGGVSTVPSDFGEYIAGDIRTMVATNRAYMPMVYKARLSPIRRALEDTTLKDPDTIAPFCDDRAKTLTLARLLATDVYLVGAVDDCQVDRTKKFAELTLKADVYDGKTGKLLKTFLVTGRAPEGTKAAEEDELRDLAKGAAVTKLVAELTAAPKEAAAEEPKPAAAEEPKSEKPAATQPAN